MLASDEFKGRDLGNVGGIDHRNTLAADRHRIDAVAEKCVLDHKLVVHEVSGSKDGGRKIRLLDHPLYRELAGEVRHVHVALAVDHRQINDAIDACFLGKIERDQSLGEFVGHDGIEKKQRRYAREGSAQGVQVEKVALNNGNACAETGFGGIAHKGANFGSALEKLVNDLAADIAGRAGNEDGHEDLSGWVVMTPGN